MVSDNAVRIWRVFPFSEDALAPLMFILNAEPATHLVFSRHRLCVAFQDASTATYNVTMFKTTESEPGTFTIASYSCYQIIRLSRLVDEKTRGDVERDRNSARRQKQKNRR